MKMILSASICAIALAAAVPAFAADDQAMTKPMSHHKHMMTSHMKKSHMMGPKTKMKPAGDPTTADLNSKSLTAARGGMAPMSSGMSAPAPMAPASGTSATTAPMNAPAGQ
jgi:hypothetical protein